MRSWNGSQWDEMPDEPPPEDFFDAEPIPVNPRRGRVIFVLAILAVCAIGGLVLAWMSLRSPAPPARAAADGVQFSLQQRLDTCPDLEGLA